ncbi:MAG: EAL domain-containing protein [Gammaproteobacteria bacterium]|nr:EAL domain-containing protein [Gammaproteobacteria bacterium]
MSLPSSLISQICSELLNQVECGVLIAEFSEHKGLSPFVEANEFICQRLGYSREVMLVNNISLFSQQYGISKLSSFVKDLMQNQGELNFRDSQLASDGSRHDVKISAKVINLENTSYVLLVCNYLQVQHSDEMEQDYIKHMLEHTWEEIYMFDSIGLYISQVNNSAIKNLGYNEQELNQIRFTEILPDLSTTAFQRLTQPLLNGQTSHLVLDAEFVRKDMSSYPVEIRLQLTDSCMPPLFIANVRDITERKRAEQQLMFLTNYDSLTGLPNRSMFIDRLTMAIENTKRTGKLVVLLFFDLDDFKLINDRQGHDVGDKIIIETGKRLIECVRKSDTVARLGGDEFGIVLTNIAGLQDVSSLAGKIINRIHESFIIDEQNYQLSCSIGISHYLMDDNDDIYSLIKMADSAMYQAKEKGKNTYQFYQSGFTMSDADRQQLAQALKQGIANNEFSVCYQPRIDMMSNDLVAAEALIRWNNTLYPGYMPDDFIPVLEANGDICEVDLWVVDQVCQQLKQWLDVKPSLKISVNLSARHFDKQELVSSLRQILIKHNVSPHNLELEITEAVLISSPQHVADTLQSLKRMGLNILLDDFGGGFSSLSYLRQFPISGLKIDRTFIADLSLDSNNQASVEAMINLASNLNLSVTAKGVETEQQAQVLRQLFCDEGQGFLFGKPLPVAEFYQLL